MAILFFLLWILLSGHVTAGVCLSGAAVSLALDLFCRRVLGYKTLWRPSAVRKLPGALRYLGCLLAEMLKAGFLVMRFIYARGRVPEPRLIRFRCGLESDAARSVLANSITLTAGTITVSAENGDLCVHALDRSMADGIENSRFAGRLKKLEE